MRTLSIAGLFLGGCCLVSPCDRAPPPPEPAHTTVEGLFIYADTSRTPARPPARFGSAWPSDLEVLTRGQWPETAPPSEQALRALCVGSPRALDAWLAAVRVSGASLERELAAAMLEHNVAYCTSRALCAAGRAKLGETTGRVRDAALLAIATCGDARDRDLLDVDEAPAAARMLWLDRRYSLERLGLRDEIATAGRVAAAGTLLSLASAPDFDRDWAARRAVATVGAMNGGSDAIRALPSLSPHARELVDEALASIRPERDVGIIDAEAVGAMSAEERRVAASERERCVGRGERDALGCLHELAMLDRERAATVAAGIDEGDPFLLDAARLLSRFRDAVALAAHLRELGLVDESCTDSGLYPSNVLAACGRALEFDMETGTFPNAHDALLVELAALAPSALDDVTFEELPPSDEPEGEPPAFISEDPDSEWQLVPEGAYMLHAYSRNERFAVGARNLGDWYDVETVVGLLNTLARERGSDVRWVVLATMDQVATVVAGRKQALEAAVAEELLEIGPAGVAEAARDREAQLLDELFQDGE